MDYMGDAKNPQDDIVSLIEADHRDVEDRLSAVAAAAGSARGPLFQQATETLVRHEVAEELVVYPALRRLDGGAEMTDARIAEQAEAEQRLSELERFRPDTAEFATTFSQLQEAVLEHASLEESGVLPLLAALPQDQRSELGHKYVSARSSGPTHPHPSAPDTPPGNALAGPVAALFDRVRDAAHHV